MNDTDISNWNNDPVKLFSTNELAKAANKESLESLNTRKYIINAQDSRKVDENTALNFTANLPASITICNGARFMLAVNLDTEDHLINGSMVTIKHIHMNSRDPLNGKIYIHFDDPVAGNKRKRSKPNKDWVPIATEVK